MMDQQQPVKELNDNDVLFGRGTGMAVFVGNKRFRSLVEDHKPEYNASLNNDEKHEIAMRVFRQVRSLRGRFLRLDDDSVGKKSRGKVENGVWYQVKEKEALEKIKQTLRQKKRERSAPSDETGGGDRQEESSNKLEADATLSNPPSAITSDDGPTDGSSSSYAAVPTLSTLPGTTVPTLSTLSPSMLPALSPTIMFPSIDDPRLMLFQTFPSVLRQQAFSNVVPAIPSTKIYSTIPLIPQAMSGTFHHHNQQQQQQMPQRLGAWPLNQQPARNPNCSLYKEQGNDDALEEPSVPSQEIVADYDKNQKRQDEDVSEFLMSVLQLSGLPRFTDYALEKDNMTDEEKASMLSDMFGKYCSVDTRKNKRARRDLDPESIAFLVELMRNEIATIPNGERQALMEAQEKCDTEEFSDARLERFLRCEDMDVPRAARRFVKYWKMRLELFGPEKFTMRMTLNEALCDDLVALKTGWLSLLPKCDSSGRQLLYMEPSKHKRDGYTSESLLRAGWYVIEVASQSNGNIVNVVWDKETTMFDFDRYVIENFTFLESECWPVKFECAHLCCTPKLLAHVVIPVISALQSKRSRTRMVMHDIPEEEILSALSEYGITKEMLPQQFGGTLFLDQLEWIAQRRAAELEETSFE